MSIVADNAGPKPGYRKQAAYLNLLDAADQWRIRGELRTFFGPRSEVFLDTYDKMRSAPAAKRAVQRSWSWPVFFGSFTWFFYRKMYTYGAMVIFMPMLLGYLFGSAGGATSIIFAMWAKTWYVSYGLNRIVKADQLGLTGAERTNYLRCAGGVSLPAGLFAGFIYACFVALLILAFAARRSAGH
jgi:hypothetical protein